MPEEKRDPSMPFSSPGPDTPVPAGLLRTGNRSQSGSGIGMVPGDGAEGEEFNVITTSQAGDLPAAAAAATGQDVREELLKGALAANPGVEGAKEALRNFKERRKSSVSKSFLGDYCQVSINPSITKMMRKNGDNRVEFSDVVIKINKRNKMQERILLISENALYNIEPTSMKVKRRIPFNELGSISLSKLADNFFCLHVPREYDYLLVCNKKTEIVLKVAELYESATGKSLQINLSNCFEYKIDSDVHREIVFASVEGGISTQIFTKSKKTPTTKK